MLPRIDFTQTNAFRYLTDHYININQYSLKELFQADPQRFDKFSIDLEEILLDYSKNRVNEETMALLMQLAKECKLEDAIRAMFAGEKINETEGRQVLHTALRNKGGNPLLVDGKDIMPQIQSVLEHMREFTNAQTLGTALGDWTADSAGLGYIGSAVLFSSMLAVVWAFYYWTSIPRTLLFWTAFVLTRPLGAVVGDFLDKPLDAGGLALSRYAASAVLFVFIMACIMIFSQRASKQAH